jgi:hypothetical protein
MTKNNLIFYANILEFFTYYNLNNQLQTKEGLLIKIVTR